MCVCVSYRVSEGENVTESDENESGNEESEETDKSESQKDASDSNSSKSTDNDSSDQSQSEDQRVSPAKNIRGMSGSRRERYEKHGKRKFKGRFVEIPKRKSSHFRDMFEKIQNKVQ